MKLRQKTLLTFIIVFNLLFMLIGLTTREILMGSFVKLEADSVSENLERVQGSLRDNISELDSTSRDYSEWDQTYQYMKNRNSSFTETEFPNETFETNRVNLLLMIDNSGSLIYGKAYDLEKKSEIELSSSVKNLLAGNGSLLSKINENTSLSGLILIDNKPLIVSIRAILTSEKTGPVGGIMIMGRYINDVEIKRLNEITHLSFSIYPLTDTADIGKAAEHAGFPQKEGEVLTLPQDSEIVSGYSLFNDIFEKPTLAIKIEMPRIIYNQGFAVAKYIRVLLLITGIVFTAAALLLIEKLILSRLSRLSREVVKIGKEKDFSSRVTSCGKDELSELGGSVNLMLSALENSMDDLRESNEKLTELDKLKTDFLSTVSHELRTPLTSILGFAKIIRKKFNSAILPLTSGSEDKRVERASRQIIENIDIIVSEGERLTSLINDVLDISKMESGKVEWKSENISIESLIERAMHSTTSLFLGKNVNFVREVETDIPEIKGDTDRLLQVVINLISNAVKFTEKGYVKCSAKVKDNEILIGVEDTGMGISGENFEKIFEKFKQVGDTLTDKPQGTGLGLAICRQIVEYHGGRIWVESTKGKGSTFYFTLPLPKSEGNERRIDVDILVKTLREQVREGISPGNVTGGNILVVDDDGNIRRLLRQELEGEGYKVTEAVDGMDALIKVKKSMPDLIILDVMMPNINGFDAAAVLKNDPSTRQIPIVIVSIVEDRNRQKSIGIDGYFKKPINTEKLLEEVQDLLNKGISNKRIMIVGDVPSALSELSDIIIGKGYNEVEICDSSNYFERARELKPDIIITDAFTSERYDIVKSLRLEKGFENILFLLLTEDKTHDWDKV